MQSAERRMGGLRFEKKKVTLRHLYGYDYVGTRLAVSAKRQPTERINMRSCGFERDKVKHKSFYSTVVFYLRRACEGGPRGKGRFVYFADRGKVKATASRA